MKYLARVAVAVILALSLPPTTYAAFPTHSITLTAASTQYLSHADAAAFDITGNLTCEVWVKFNSLPTSGNDMPLCTKWLRGGNQRSYEVELFYTGSNYELRSFVSANGSTNDDTNVLWNTVTTGTWYHIVWVYTAASSKYQYYVGTEAAADTQQGTDQTGSRTAIFSGTAKFELGSNDGDEAAGGLLDGKLVLQQLWSATRTTTSMANDRCGALGVTSGLNGEWSLDNVLTDDSGHSNTLTNNGSATFGRTYPCLLAAEEVA